MGEALSRLLALSSVHVEGHTRTSKTGKRFHVSSYVRNVTSMNLNQLYAERDLLAPSEDARSRNRYQQIITEIRNRTTDAIQDRSGSDLLKHNSDSVPEISYPPGHPKAPAMSEGDASGWLFDEWREFQGEAEDVPEWDDATVRMVDALAEYTAHGHAYINRYLRDGMGSPAAETATSHLDQLFQSDRWSRTTSQSMEVYRGGYYFDAEQLKPGAAIRDRGFLSTSTLKSEAALFGKTFKIQVPKGTKFLPGHIGEREMIFPRDSILEVVSVDPLVLQLVDGGLR